MATGQLLRNVSGQLLINADGKIKRWAPDIPSLPGSDPTEFWRHGRITFISGTTEIEWDAIGAGLLATRFFTNEFPDPSNEYGSIKWYHRVLTSGHVNHYGWRWNVSEQDGETLYVVMEEKSEGPFHATDLTGAGVSNIAEDVTIRFVYELSNKPSSGPNAWSLTNDQNLALPIIGSLTVQEILDYNGDAFAFALPDTTGYDYIYIGFELVWIYDSTLWLPYNGVIGGGHPDIDCKFDNAKIVSV